jgi:hypothetical protein
LPALFLLVPAPAARPAASGPAGLDCPSPATAAVEGDLPPRAHVWGKYRTLLRKLTVPEDVEQFARFHDWGPWTGTEWRNHKGLPPGHWVYVYPHWYIWRDCTLKP